jgi:PIN domain nuclease of toxin-antitoxin system
VAKLVELGRLQLAIPVDQWLTQALQSPVQLLPLTVETAVGSTRLPGSFHRDPADQLIVATARHYDCALVTLDRLIRAYPHVRLAP